VEVFMGSDSAGTYYGIGDDVGGEWAESGSGVMASHVSEAMLCRN
jgi:hypothetical protein